MRYYNIVITDPKTGKVFATYSSLMPNGTVNPAALLVEMDIPVVNYATPDTNAFLRIWGIPLQSISQSSDFNGKIISISGGMSAGLPLAKAEQSGLLLEGNILQAFGNWQGTSQTLDLIIQAATGSIQHPANIVNNWLAGTALSDAIAATLKTAFPAYTANINISDSLVLTQDEPGFFQTIGQFAQYVKQVSQAIVGSNYQGVDILLRQNVFSVYDGTTPTSPKSIQFTDLIGQPTWINAGTINVKCIMRADIVLSDYVTLPKTQVTTTTAAQSQYKDSSAFQGTYQINSVRHVGNSRQPDGNAWVTSYDMSLTATPTATT